MGLEGPHQLSIDLRQCLFKAEKKTFCCDASIELGKLSHWARKCLSPGFSLSHSINAGKAPPQPPPEILHASVTGFLSLPSLPATQILAGIKGSQGRLHSSGIVSFLKTRVSYGSLSEEQADGSRGAGRAFLRPDGYPCSTNIGVLIL